jgi:small neutral amino acid transporter SnatA (MarC family)
VKSIKALAWWFIAMLGPVGYVLPMAIPLLIGNYWIAPLIDAQSWPGWYRIVFWMLYTSVSTGLTFAATIMAVQTFERSRSPA